MNSEKSDDDSDSGEKNFVCYACSQVFDTFKVAQAHAAVQHGLPVDSNPVPVSAGAVRKDEWEQSVMNLSKELEEAKILQSVLAEEMEGFRKTLEQASTSKLFVKCPHRETNRNPSIFSCFECRLELGVHTLENVKEGTSRESENKDSTGAGLAASSDEQLKCLTCGKHFSTKSSLYRHIRTIHERDLNKQPRKRGRPPKKQKQCTMKYSSGNLKTLTLRNKSKIEKDQRHSGMSDTSGVAHDKSNGQIVQDYERNQIQSYEDDSFESGDSGEVSLDEDQCEVVPPSKSDCEEHLDSSSDETRMDNGSNKPPYKCHLCKIKFRQLLSLNLHEEKYHDITTILDIEGNRVLINQKNLYTWGVKQTTQGVKEMEQDCQSRIIREGKDIKKLNATDDTTTSVDSPTITADGSLMSCSEGLKRHANEKLAPSNKITILDDRGNPTKSTNNRVSTLVESQDPTDLLKQQI